MCCKRGSQRDHRPKMLLTYAGVRRTSVRSDCLLPVQSLCAKQRSHDVDQWSSRRATNQGRRGCSLEGCLGGAWTSLYGRAMPRVFAVMEGVSRGQTTGRLASALDWVNRMGLLSLGSVGLLILFCDTAGRTGSDWVSGVASVLTIVVFLL